MRPAGAVRGTRPGRVWGLALAGLVVFALLGLWSAGTGAGPPGQEDRVRAAVAGLRCPTCAGESVAHSAAPLAEAMRTVATDQVAQGRSPAQVQAWFAQRYGDEVLLDPPRRGAGWLLWSLPLALAAGGAVLWLLPRGAGRRAPVLVGVVVVPAVLVGSWALTHRGLDLGAPGAEGPGRSAPVAGPGADGAVQVLADAVLDRPGDVGLRLTLAGALEAEQRHGAAAEQFAAAVRLRPLDPDLRYRHAFALVRSDDGDAAVGELREGLVLEPDHPPSLLLLGTLLRRAGDAQGEVLLARFVELAPGHPAAEEVGRILDGMDPPDGEGTGDLVLDGEDLPDGASATGGPGSR